MALHSVDNNRDNQQPQQNKVEAQPAVEQQYQPLPEQNTPPQNPQPTSNFFQNHFGSGSKLDIVRNAAFKPFGSGGVSERINKIYQLYQQTYEEKRQTDPTVMDANFVIASPSRIDNLYGGIIVVLPVTTQQGQLVYGTHFLVVENSVRPMKQTEVFEGQQYHIYNTASNTVTDRTRELIAQLVRLTSKNQEAVVIDSGFTVIPEEVSLSDDATLLNILDVAAGAALTRVQLQTGQLEDDVAYVLADAVNTQGVNLHASVDEDPTDPVDITGQPIRSKFRIRTIANQGGGQNQLTQQAVEIGSVDVYCSPVYSQPAMQYGMNGQLMPAPHYYNMLVIRDIKTGPEIRLATANLLMLIATTGLLAQDRNWMRAYVPNLNIKSSELDINDIGALGYEMTSLNADNRPGMVNTKTVEFDTTAFYNYMGAAFHEQVIYAIDVPDGHYLLEMFMAEATGDQTARDYIYNIVNNLTNGQFARLLPASEQMFTTTGTRIINGYYTDRATGKPKPIDNLDHLAMLNLVKDDARSIAEFESSFVGAQSTTLALAIRTAMMETLADNTLKVRSYSTRLYVNPRFMEALISALRTARLFPEVSNQYKNFQSYARPSADFWGRFAVNPGHLPNLFNMGNHQWKGGQVQQPYQQNFGHVFGR